MKRRLLWLECLVIDWLWSTLVGGIVARTLFKVLRKVPASSPPKSPPPAPPAPPSDQVDALRYAQQLDSDRRAAKVHQVPPEEMRKMLEQLLGRPVSLVGGEELKRALDLCQCPRCTERRKQELKS